MTNTPELLPKRQRRPARAVRRVPRRGPARPHRRANGVLGGDEGDAGARFSGYERCTASLEGGLVRSAEGLELQTGAGQIPALVGRHPRRSRLAAHDGGARSTRRRWCKWLRRASRARVAPRRCAAAPSCWLRPGCSTTGAPRRTGLVRHAERALSGVQLDRDAIFVRGRCGPRPASRPASTWRWRWSRPMRATTWPCRWRGTGRVPAAARRPVAVQRVAAGAG